MKKGVIITDLRLVASGDQWGAVAELEDGSEVPVWAVNGNAETPPWLKSERQYEEWYNRALDEAHRQGMCLEGECKTEGVIEKSLYDANKSCVEKDKLKETP